jgi:hypothetical protein
MHATWRRDISTNFFCRILAKQMGFLVAPTDLHGLRRLKTPLDYIRANPNRQRAGAVYLWLGSCNPELRCS